MASSELARGASGMGSAGTGGSGTRTRKLRLFPLLAATYFMVSGGPYDLEDIIGYAGYGHALLLLLLLPFVWSFPTALMLGELSAAVPAEGGFYAWVRRAMGPFWGFQEAWLSLASSVFDMAIYPTTFVLYLERIAPNVTRGHGAIVLELSIVVGAVLWNLRGAAAVGEGSVKLWMVSISPYAVLVGIAVYIGFQGMHGQFGGHASMVRPVGRDFSTAILVAMWNYMGWDNASTIAAEVERPRRTYPVAMLVSVALVALTYVLPVAAVGRAGLDAHGWQTGAWVDAATAIGGRALGVAVVAGGVLCAFGMFNALVLSYSRLPLALAEDGFLPRLLARRSARTGVPVAAVVACAVAYALALGLGFERLVQLDVLLYGLSLILEFAALIALRVRAPQMPRPFRIPGGIAGAVALSLPPTALIVFAFFRGGGESEHFGALSPIALGGILILVGIVVYAVATRRPGAQAPRSGGQ